METSKITAVIDEICQKIGGSWLLTGGGLVQLHFKAERATEDVDLVPIHHDRLSDVAAQNQLFQSAIRLGLGPENVNSAAQFFVNQIPDWKSHVVLLKSGAEGSVYRPDLTLFIVLKLHRATPIDLEDIASAVQALGKSEFNFENFKKMGNDITLKRFLSHQANWGL